ncbi:hypothetical protein ZOSMA_1G02500 [Zostera marina]|uniref:Regulator of chromosome condensation (RCC1) family protein n=1 Tax=Zostera marina TaxID=29655 RepID=A0A0K9PMH5_ZOSMR|nr:hypothetical protein ZOSMA_1G02500 [Zostera marina]
MTTAEVGQKTEEEKVKSKPLAGELLYFGGTSWETMGRRGTATGNCCLQLVSAPSCHCVALDIQGRCYTWGRNEKGQLGHGDMLQRNLSTMLLTSHSCSVWELGLRYKIVKAGSRRNHIVVVTDDNKSFSFGWNKHGQLGSGSLKNEIEASPVPCLLSQATDVFCGADFTV